MADPKNDPYAATADDPYAATADSAPAAKAVPLKTPTIAKPPESTATKVGRGGALGAFEGLGVKPAATGSEVIQGSLHQFGQGLKNLIADTWQRNSSPGSQASPAGQALPVLMTALDLIPTAVDQTATGLEQGMKDTYQAVQNKDWEAAAENATKTIAQIAMLRAGRRAAGNEAFDTVGTVRKAAGKAIDKAIGPRTATITGETVPVLVGESEPASTAGMTQSVLKKSGGVGAGKFTQFAAKQLGSVKQVIRNVAQETSGAIGPMPDEPAAAMKFAADTTFEKARPMYNALDKSLVTVPESLQNVSNLVQRAVNRAKTLGVEIQPESESVMMNGREVTAASDPRTWQLLKDQGIVSDAGQPITTFMKVRSELLKMQRGSSDAATRYAIGNEVTQMNSAMEGALSGTPLADVWKQADALWSKGYAIRSVAQAIKKTAKGTPSAIQAEGIGKIPTVIRGGQLVGRLNELDSTGVLEKAFGKQGAINLRQAADILDRSSEKVGSEFKIGYGPHSTLWRNLVTAPLYPVIKAMTNTEAVDALKAGDAATNPASAAAGFDRFARLAGLAGIEIPKKQPGQQIKDLRSITGSSGSNPGMPIGPEP